MSEEELTAREDSAREMAFEAVGQYRALTDLVALRELVRHQQADIDLPEFFAPAPAFVAFGI